MIRKVKGRVHIPVVAIGGICPDVMEEVFESGADAVAAASSILRGDVQANARVFLKRLHCI
jgi:thiamine-phosphate pyrophosphorylase